MAGQKIPNPRALLRRLMREFEVLRRAEVDAASNVPGDAYSSTEQRLEAYVLESAAAEAAALRLALKSDELASVVGGLEASEANFTGLVTATGSVMQARAADLPRLQAAADAAVRKAAADEERFKRVHLLDREARYHDPLLGAGIMLAVGAADAGITGMVFSEVTKWGLLGGVAKAALLTAPTVAMGVTLGALGLRYMAHVRAAFRTVGTVVTVHMAACIGTWAFYLAHLRQLAESAARAGKELEVLQAGVLSQIASNPLAFLESWEATVLLILTFVTAGVAVWHGYAGISDPYPGFKEVAEKHRRAVAEAAQVVREFEGSVSDVAVEAIKRIQVRRRGFDRAAKAVMKALVSARGKVAAYEAAVAAHTSAAAECVRAYRDLNARRRAPGTAPARFAEPVSFNLPMSDVDFDPTEARQRLQAAQRKAHVAADDAIGRIRLLRTEVVAHALGGRRADLDHSMPAVATVV